MAEITTVASAEAALSRIIETLGNASSIDEMKNADLLAGLCQEMAKAKLGLAWANKFTIVRFDAMRAIGTVLVTREKNLGGKPSTGGTRLQDSPLTYTEMGLKPRFARECIRSSKIAKVVYDKFCAIALAADDTIDPDETVPQYKRPIELTKKGLFDYADAYSWVSNQQRQEQDEIIEEAEKHADDPMPPPRSKPHVDWGSDQTEPEELRQGYQEALDIPDQQTVIGMLKILVDGEGELKPEQKNALGLIRRRDPRLSVLDTPAIPPSAFKAHEYLLSKHNEMYAENARLKEQLKAAVDNDRVLELERLVRKQRQIIRDLKVANNQLTARLEALDPSYFPS